jgi:thiamine-monophosphate kinase
MGLGAPRTMDETTLLRLIQRRAPALRLGFLIQGIGDDCAIVRPPSSTEDWVFTTDMVIEDRHFRRATYPAGTVGHRTLARGLSDIAAMGAEPRFCLLSIALAPWTDSRWLDRFFRGFHKLAGEARTPLVGGDLARADKLSCDIVVCGAVPRGKSLRRTGARPGDAIYVSGRLGGSALGLRTMRGKAWQVHLRPQPRLRLGRFLRERLHATAAMDLSDGLSLDLRRLCLASGVAAELDRDPPVFPRATLEDALHGGEDYELLFTLPEDTRVPAGFEGLPLVRVGTIRKGRAGFVRFRNRRLEPEGWDHFRR